MRHFQVERDPLRIQAAGTTRAGLLTAALDGLFEAGNIAIPEAGEDVKRSFELEASNAPELLLAVLRAAAGSASANGDRYTEISFSLITDRKATGAFVGRPAGGTVTLPAIRGIDGEVVKDADGVWRATIALGA